MPDDNQRIRNTFVFLKQWVIEVTVNLQIEGIELCPNKIEEREKNIIDMGCVMWIV